jgi:hypothetical protein
MYATWESQKTSRDRNARLKIFVDESDEKKEGETQSLSEEAKRMAPHGAAEKN